MHINPLIHILCLYYTTYVYLYQQEYLTKGVRMKTILIFTAIGLANDKTLNFFGIIPTSIAIIVLFTVHILSLNSIYEK